MAHIPTGAHENINSQGFLCNMKNVAVLLQIIPILSLRISRYCTHTVQVEENARYFEKVSCLSLGLYLKGQ